MNFLPGSKVRVVNPSHWLFDKIGYVVKPTLETSIKQVMAGGPKRAGALGVPVDFQRRLHGWFETPLKGERKVVTHNCDGALKRATGYYMLARDLKLEDVPGSYEISRGIATPRSSR